MQLSKWEDIRGGGWDARVDPALLGSLGRSQPLWSSSDRTLYSRCNLACTP